MRPCARLNSRSKRNRGSVKSVGEPSSATDVADRIPCPADKVRSLAARLTLRYCREPTTMLTDRRLAAVAGSRMDAERIPMLRKLLDISGSMTSVLSGALGMSEQHRLFLSGGLKCPHCNERLMNAVGVVTATFYAADGSRMSNGLALGCMPTW
jgi:hypothetical protein